MAITYLKKSPKTSSTDDNKTTGIVQDLLKNIETTKEQGCIELTKKFDKYDGEIIVSKDKIEEIKKTLDQKTKDDIQFSFCLLYTSPSPRDLSSSRMPSSA